jgi:hypothetical protein
MQIYLPLKNEKDLKISFAYSLGIIRLTYKNNQFIHDNVIKIDEIKNLFLDENGMNIVTEITNFQYKFSEEIPDILARKIYNEIANNYINYYSIQIDNKNLLLEDLNEQEEKNGKNFVTNKKNQ